jgi:hypothetical protein
MAIYYLPSEIESVFCEFRTCEFSTLAKDGTPITWPVVPLFQLEKGQFLIITSIGLPQKAYNVRRNPKVSLLFSDPTGSGLVDPPAVLVQGDAEAPEEIGSVLEFRTLAQLIAQRQPNGVLFSSNSLMRRLFDWYYIRLPINVTVRRLVWWDQGDFTRVPHEKEM